MKELGSNSTSYHIEILDTITDDHRREYVLRPDFINSFKLLID